MSWSQLLAVMTASAVLQVHLIIRNENVNAIEISWGTPRNLRKGLVLKGHFLGAAVGELKSNLFRHFLSGKKTYIWVWMCPCKDTLFLTFHILPLSFLLAFCALWGAAGLSCLPIWSIAVAYLTSKDVSLCSFCWRLYNGWVILNGNMRVTNHFHTETQEITL